MRVTGKRVMVRQDASENKVGALYVPQGSERYPNFGTVVSVGAEVAEIKAGDRVLFQRKPSTAVAPDARPGDEYYGILVLPEDHILAVVVEDLS